MSANSVLPLGIRSYLGDFVAQSKRAALTRATGAALAVFLLWMTLWCGLDRVLHLTSQARLLALGVGVATVAAIIVRPLLSKGWRNDWVTIAHEIERRNPRFGQRLITVTSRLLGAPDHRGSDEILRRLVREVEQDVAVERARRRMPGRPMLMPWLAFAAALLLVVGLFRVPQLEFSQLVLRFVDPLSDRASVTTTHLRVVPGDVPVVQSEPLRIEAEAERLPDGTLWLYSSDDDRHWTRSVMNPMGNGKYAFTLNSVDRDFRYYIAGGDAESRRFNVRALRRPVVSLFRIQYVYPSYTQLAPQTVSNTDGVIEAPAGTEAHLTVTATEPLQSALLTVNAEKVLMSRTDRENVRQATIVVRNDAPCSLDLISTREVPGGGPSTMHVRALPDLPPRVRLLQTPQGGDNLRLNARDILPLSYQALDDYGIKSVAVRVQVNAQHAVELPISPWGDPRRQEDVFNLDLATLPLNVGDVVTLTLTVTDSAGQHASSDETHVLISPRSIDLGAYERIAELNNAAKVSQAVTEELDAANKALDEAAAQVAHPPIAAAASARADRYLAGASQAATLARQSLLRALTRSRSKEMSIALAGWVDGAEALSAAAEDLFRRGGIPSGMGDTARDKLRRALEHSRELESHLKTAAQGERAFAALADRENLLATQAKPAPQDPKAAQRLQETLRRTQEDVAAEATELGINPAAGDLDVQLRGKLDAATGVIASCQPIDFAAIARDWSHEMQSDPHQRLGLEGRLSAAAQAEAIRPGSDLIRARDLHLASRAAAAIALAAVDRAQGQSVTDVVLNSFASDVGALDQEFAIRRAAGEAKPEHAPIHAAADKARLDLSRWAGEAGAWASADTKPQPGATTVATTAAANVDPALERQREAESLAMQASAAAAERNYDRAARLDELREQRLLASRRRDTAPKRIDTIPSRSSERGERNRQRLENTMASARTLDGLGQAQEKLAKQTIGSKDPQTKPASSGELVGQQKNVAEEIARVERGQRSDAAIGIPSAAPIESNPADDANWRSRAAEAVLQSQELLAAMPQQLGDAQDAAANQRDAASRAATAHRAAETAPSDRRPSADLASGRAGQEARDAADRLARTMQPVSAAAGEALCARLEPFAPEASTACDVIRRQLVPALRVLEEASKAGDATAAGRAAAEARAGIESAQRELAAAQDAFTERDPLMAARWFARAAADSLSSQPPDLQRAQRHQMNASVALARAWDQSIHRAATVRLSDLPSMQPVLAPGMPDVPREGATAGITPKFATAREWGRLRPREDEEVAAPLRESDPPGYEEALKLYFQALNNGQESTKK